MANFLVLLTLCTSLVLGQVDELLPDTDMGAAVLERAKTYARIGDWENGIRFLEPYILAIPEDAEARLLLAECYFNWPDKQTLGTSVVDKNQERGKTQIGILAKLGDKGFEMLLRGLYSDTSWVFRACRDVLAEKKDRRAIDPLIKLATEEPNKASSVINTLVSIERDREEVDHRVVKLLVSILEKPEDAVGTGAVAAAAQAVASLRVRQAAPSVNKELKRVIAVLPTAADQDTKYLLRETVHLVDAVASTVPEDLDKHVTPVLNMMVRRQRVDLLEQARSVLRELNVETLEFLTKTALTMAKADPSIAWPADRSPPRLPQVVSYRDWGARWGSPLDRFLFEVSTRHPAVMLEPRIKELLHELCDAPRAEVRLGILEIIGNIRDEDALPILFPKLRASWFETSVSHYATLTGSRMLRGINEFGWVSEESVVAWRAVKAIGSPKTAEFLLEKLESQDMGWVYTAAALLMDIGEGRAIEPLKKRYSELSETEADQAKEVRQAIERAYRELSGRSITEPDA
jgi:HEAT repeat protein